MKDLSGVQEGPWLDYVGPTAFAPSSPFFIKQRGPSYQRTCSPHAKMQKIGPQSQMR